jgi:glutamate-1-semialdehyde aminotransferase
MATFAKAISNGFALGAVVGRREVMEVAEDSFISSVYWAEATGLAAGKATLMEYIAHDVCGAVRCFGKAFVEGLYQRIEHCGVPIKVVGPPFSPSLAFDDFDPIRRDQLTTLYMQEIAKRGLYGGPGHFFCFRHTETDLVQGLEILRSVMTVLRKALDDGDILRFLECPVRQASFRRLV